jgi:hypothetical protein
MPVPLERRKRRRLKYLPTSLLPSPTLARPDLHFETLPFSVFTLIPTKEKFFLLGLLCSPPAFLLRFKLSEVLE